MTDEKRPYRKRRRAELEQRTRQRITESAVELHGTLGPSRTSLSAIAEHAGVRRSTL
jgi:AcrR family transcriptional regulator